jgi:hypothetical protein
VAAGLHKANFSQAREVATMIEKIARHPHRMDLWPEAEPHWHRKL